MEGDGNHLDNLVDGVSILKAMAFVQMAAIEKNFGHDGWQFFCLSLLIDLC